MDTDPIQEASHLFPLPTAITIETVDSLTAQLKALPLSSGATLIMDASQTEILTTPGAQLLLSLDKTLAAHRSRLLIVNANDTIRLVLQALGLRATFTGWSNADA